jgi:hypothetical protein
MMNLKDSLFAAAKTCVKSPVDVSDYMPDAKLFVKVISGTDLDFYIGTFKEARETNNWTRSRATLVAMSIVNEFGEPLASRDDIPAIADWNHLLLTRIFDEAFRLNKIGGDEAAQTEKN